MNSIPITRLSGPAVVGGYIVSLDGRAAPLTLGSVFWYRQYRRDAKRGNAWLPTGRPRKAVFVRMISRDFHDDKWEVTDWGSHKRGFFGGLLIGSKSLHHIEFISP
ncbi:MAG: hypothetical protein WC378_05275 [Opitutaceae bacterium]|jgi:hypothetical protein